MLSAISKYWKEIVTVLIILMIIGAGFWFYNQADSQKTKAQDTLAGQMASLSNVEFSNFDNKLVIGSDVRDAAARFKDKAQFSVLIKTGANPSGYYAENTSTKGSVVAYAEPSSGNKVGDPGTASTVGTLAEMKDESDTKHYVSNTGKFDSKVYVDNNAEVKLIVFTQR